MREPYLTCCKGHNTPVSEVLNFLICLFILHCKHLNNPYIEAFREVDSDLRFVQGFFMHTIYACAVVLMTLGRTRLFLCIHLINILSMIYVLVIILCHVLRKKPPVTLL